MISVSVFQRTRKAGVKTKTWSLRYQCPISGKRIIEATKVTRKSVAKELARKKQRELELIASGIQNPADRLHRATWAEARKAFLDSVRVRNSEGTFENYQRSLEHFERIVQPRSARSITAVDVERFVAGLHETCKPVTINKHLRQLGRFLRWGKDMGFVDHIPKLTKLKQDRKLPVKIPPDAQAKLLAATHDPDCEVRFRSRGWWRVWIKTLFYTGCRRGELLNLIWDDISWDEKHLLVQAEHEKTHRDRVIPLCDGILEALKTWWTASESPDGSMHVFPVVQESCRQVYDDWIRIREYAGVGDVTFKNARSTAGSELAAEHPLPVVQGWLGHSNPNTTSQYYVNSQDSVRAAAARRKVIGDTNGDTSQLAEDG